MAVKVLRELQEAHGELGVSARSARRYISALKETVSVKQVRYYEPVLDLAPGVQCQVDGGELRGVMIGGRETTVYFVVFVLSYSRLMQVVASPRAVDTAVLIRMHDAAFRAFGGYPKEYVYDQTSLVVIAETFRELTLNQRFHRGHPILWRTPDAPTARRDEAIDPQRWTQRQVILLPQKGKQFVLEVVPELRQAGLTGSIHLGYRNESLLTISFYQPLAGHTRSSPLFSPPAGENPSTLRMRNGTSQSPFRLAFGDNP
ncbi:MAG: DDE-type integrase/transposase/recombinase [Chromatiaceae bacterium]|nr:DDE-type integrase/transposase/recombinase [Chromatiaceae bacterium]